MRVGPFALLLSLACALHGVASTAAADDGPPPAPPASPTPLPPSVQPQGATWYGWETLAVDFGSTTLIVAGFGGGTRGSDVLGLAGLGTYALGPPIVHLARGNYGRSAISLGARLALPVIGFFIGAALGAASRSDDPSKPLAEGVLGAGFAMVAAVPIDACLLSWEAPAGAAPSPAAVAPSGSALVLPTLAVLHDAEGRRYVAVGAGAAF